MRRVGWTLALAWIAGGCGDEPSEPPVPDAPGPAASPVEVELDLGPDHPPANTPGEPARRDRIYRDAQTLVAAGQFKQAIRRLEKAIAAGPEDGATRLLLGICRSHDRDDIAGARRELRRAHQLDGVKAEAAYLLSELDRKMANVDRASAWLDEALRHDPDHEKAQVGKATLLRRAGDTDEAAALIERHLATHPRSAPGFRERGALHVRTGRLSEAVDDFRQAVEIDPTDTASWFQLATVLRREGRVDEAAAAQRDFELLKGVFSDSRHDLETDAGTRERLLREIIDRFPGVWRAHHELARQLAATDGARAAVAALRVAIARHPAVPELRAALAQHLEQIGDHDGAEAQRAEAKRLLAGAESS